MRLAAVTTDSTPFTTRCGFPAWRLITSAASPEREQELKRISRLLREVGR